jgi:cytochrome c-type biogenesis protein CcmH
MVARYGEFILFRPRMNLRNLWLWGLPAALMLIGAVIGWRVLSARQRLLDLNPDTSEEESLES